MNHSFRGKVAVVLGASAAAGTGWAMAKALWGAAARSSLARGACRSLSHWLVPSMSRLSPALPPTCDALMALIEVNYFGNVYFVKHMAKAIGSNGAIPGMEELFSRDVPLGRIGEPEDFADAVLWLAGASYVTGLNLPVSGGLHLLRSPLLSEMPGASGQKT